MNENNEVIQNGDLVLVYIKERTSWLITVHETYEFHTHFGVIPHVELINRKYGSVYELPNGKKAFLLKPSLRDLINFFKHQSQIIYPEDAAIISLFTGLRDGLKVIEAGTGSGALTSIIATQIMPTGKVYTYDNRENASNTARKNLEKAKISNVEFFVHDVREGFFQDQVDAIILDLVDPWEVIPHAWNTLVPCGTICIFQPTYNQIEKTTLALDTYSFKRIEVFEMMRRDIQIKRGAIRPSTRMIGHTGFLIFATKTEKES